MTAKLRWRPYLVVDRPVTRYRVKAMRVSDSGAVLGTTYRHVGGDRVSLTVPLPQRGTYQFRLRAMNEVGRSNWSARSDRVQGR